MASSKNCREQQSGGAFETYWKIVGVDRAETEHPDHGWKALEFSKLACSSLNVPLGRESSSYFKL